MTPRSDASRQESILRRKLTTAALAAFRTRLRIGRRLGRRPPRVFCVGFNKTGTTSLHELFVKLGFRSHHGLRWHDAEQQEMYDEFDCFSDGFPLWWRLLVDEYPRSRFILNVRRCDEWILSRLRHIARTKREGTYDGGQSWGAWDDTPEAVTSWIRDWQHHHLEVLRTFRKQPNRLLVVNVIADPGAASRVAKFLGFPLPLPTPHANRGSPAERDEAYVAMIDHACRALGIPPSDLENDLLIPALLAGADASFPKRTGWPKTTG